MLLPETLVMLYMKVVGKTQDEVCGSFLACSGGFFSVEGGALTSLCCSKLLGFWKLSFLKSIQNMSYFCVTAGAHH